MSKTRRDELAAEERAKYEYRLEVVLTLAQATELKRAICRADDDGLLDGLHESLVKGIDWAWRYCDDAALTRSIFEAEE